MHKGLVRSCGRADFFASVPDRLRPRPSDRRFDLLFLMIAREDKIMDVKGLLCVLARVAAAPAAAEDGFTEGIYLESKALCDQARKDSLQSVIDAGNTALSAYGLVGVEYNCEFFQVAKATTSPSWVVTALCAEPGYVYPDVLSVTQVSATEIELASVRAEVEGGIPGNGGAYVLCDGVTMP